MEDDLLRFLEPLGCRPPASQAALESVASRFSGRLPGDYLGFLACTNGYEGAIGRSSYAMLWAAEELPDFNEGYQVQVYAPGLVLFGSSGGGEAFGFDLRGPLLSVVEIPFVGMDWTYANRVSGSFRGFLEHLHGLA